MQERKTGRTKAIQRKARDKYGTSHDETGPDNEEAHSLREEK